MPQTTVAKYNVWKNEQTLQEEFGAQRVHDMEVNSVVSPSKPSYVPTIRESSRNRHLRLRFKKLIAHDELGQSIQLHRLRQERDKTLTRQLQKKRENSKLEFDEKDVAWTIMVMDVSTIQYLKHVLSRNTNGGTSKETFVRAILHYLEKSDTTALQEEDPV